MESLKTPSLDAIDKPTLLATLRQQIAADLAALVRTQTDTQEAATHEEARAEHAKDTRATEQSYLARGLAERVDALQETLHVLENIECPPFEADAPIGLTALVHVQNEESEGPEIWWMLPVAGGVEVRADAHTVRTLSPAAPLGRALIGLQTGDEGSFESPGGTRSFEILEVR